MTRRTKEGRRKAVSQGFESNLEVISQEAAVTTENAELFTTVCLRRQCEKYVELLFEKNRNAEIIFH